MKKLNTLVVLLLLISQLAFSAVVNEQTASTVALSFFRLNTPPNPNVNLSATLSYTRSEDNGTVDFYVFDISPAKGFVIVTADDIFTPILGYSTAGYFNPNFQNIGLNDMVKDYVGEMRYDWQQPQAASLPANSDWALYLQGINPNSSRNGQVGPLLHTTWNQSPGYNKYAPFNTSLNPAQQVPIGCGATAMGQILKFWNYPSTGLGGVKTYAWHHWTNTENFDYGNSTTNFGAQPYQWSQMPLTLNSNSSPAEIDAVAYLLYQVAVSVEMMWSVSVGSGSYMGPPGASWPTCADAYVAHFGYASGIQQVEKATNPSGWVNLLKTELDAGRIMQYAGDDATQGGHTWVCDGYDANNFMSMNWGWGGSNNGFFSVSNLTTWGSYNPVNNQEALIRIHPPAPTCAAAFTSQDNGNGLITFTDASTGTANPTYSWNFGDGGTSSLQNPIHSFSLTGNYHVCLTVANQSCSNTTCHDITIAGSGCNAPTNLSTLSTDTSSANLTWGSVAGSYGYQIQYRPVGSNNWSLINDSIGGNSCYLGYLACGTTYEWEVQVFCNSGGASAFSAISTFTTAACNSNYYPPAPAIVYPTDSTDYCADHVDFSWQPVPNASGYWFQLAYDPGFQYPIISDSSSTSFYINYGNVTYSAYNFPQNGSVYYWRVFPFNANGLGYSSQEVMFFNCVCTGIPNAPDLLGPIAGDGNVSRNSNVTFDWTKSSCALYYEFDISTDYTFSTADTFNWPNNSITLAWPTAPACNTVYYWRVRTINANGFSDFSSVERIVFGCDSTTGIKNTPANNLALKVYPNPANEVLMIDAGSLTGTYQMQILNTIGEVVKQSSGSLNGDLIKTDVSKFASGLYTIQLKTATGRANSKFIVK